MACAALLDHTREPTHEPPRSTTVTTAVAESLSAHAVSRLRAAAVGAAGLEAHATGQDAEGVRAAAEAAGDAWDMQYPTLAYLLDPDAQSTVNIPLREYTRLLEIEREVIEVGGKVLKGQRRQDKRIRLGVFRKAMALVGITLPPIDGEFTS